MAEEGSGNDIGFFFLFFIGIFFLWLASSTGEGGLLGRPFSTTTPANVSTRNESITAPRAASSRQAPAPQRSNSSIESDLSDSYRQIDILREEVREAKIWGVRSPFEGNITLSRGNVYTDDVDEEYIRVRANFGIDEPIDISGWLLESYVTDEGASIPFGSRLAFTGRVNDVNAIIMESNDTAIVTTGESPIGVAFHENLCTGYFNQFQDFFPGLSQSCPRPATEMERFAQIDLDNDNCYEFVERLSSCQLVLDEATDTDPPISNRCRDFVVNDLTYAGCVANHRFEPFFDKGEWRIYLNSEDELWRDEREIIKLIDREGRTVDVLEY